MKRKSKQSLLYHFNNMTKIFSYLVLCYLLLIITGCRSQINPNDRLPNNFYKISEEIYRSEQPSPQQMQYLAELGVKTVINLRLWHSDQDEITNTTITEVPIKLRAGKITDEKIIETLKVINKSPKPILIHCWHGSDRTGVVVAMYRLVFQKWTKYQAINELMQPEFGHHSNIYPNIVKYIENADIVKIREAVFH